jgi:hypothetical protein
MYCGAYSSVLLLPSYSSVIKTLWVISFWLCADMCSSLDELSRRQQSSGATQDPLREVSVSQTDRDSDADDVGSPLHPLNHRLWSSNSDDSVTAAVAIPTDNDANSCAMRRQAPGDSGMQTIRQHSHITLGTHQTAASCKRSLVRHETRASRKQYCRLVTNKVVLIPPDLLLCLLAVITENTLSCCCTDLAADIRYRLPTNDGGAVKTLFASMQDDATAGSHPDKRQRLSHDVADSQTVETFDVDPDVIERRRRRQQKLGGCKPASRQLPSVSTPRILATPSHQHLQPQPSLRRNATRQTYTVVLQVRGDRDSTSTDIPLGEYGVLTFRLYEPKDVSRANVNSRFASCRFQCRHLPLTNIIWS